MKTNKIALALTGLVLMVLMVPLVFANGNGEPGYTPGFWKHNIGVYLGENPGEYSAFNDGTKVDAEILEGLGIDLQAAYAALSAKGPGSDTVRADMANDLNTAAGFGPFVDED